MSEDKKLSPKTTDIKVKVKHHAKSPAVTVINKEQFTKMVDEVLESNGVPRRYLYEYPYNEFESDRLIRNAENTVTKIAEILKMRINRV